jgi:hypothetical protein
MSWERLYTTGITTPTGDTDVFEVPVDMRKEMEGAGPSTNYQQTESELEIDESQSSNNLHQQLQQAHQNFIRLQQSYAQQQQQLQSQQQQPQTSAATFTAGSSPTHNLVHNPIPSPIPFANLTHSSSTIPTPMHRPRPTLIPIQTAPSYRPPTPTYNCQIDRYKPLSEYTRSNVFNVITSPSASSSPSSSPICTDDELDITEEDLDRKLTETTEYQEDGSTITICYKKVNGTIQTLDFDLGRVYSRVIRY